MYRDINLIRELGRDNRGMIQPVIGLFAIMFLIVLISAVLNIAAYKAISDRLEDALAASSLAACMIDIERYGTDHSLLISDIDNAYEKYKETLDINLDLTHGVASAGSAIDGEVIIDSFRIYNVLDGNVTEIIVSEQGLISVTGGRLGEFRAPNGQLIENTGVYSEISFPVNNRFGKGIRAKKCKLTSVNTF